MAYAWNVKLTFLFTFHRHVEHWQWALFAQIDVISDIISLPFNVLPLNLHAALKFETWNSVSNANPHSTHTKSHSHPPKPKPYPFRITPFSSLAFFFFVRSVFFLSFVWLLLLFYSKGSCSRAILYSISDKSQVFKMFMYQSVFMQAYSCMDIRILLISFPYTQYTNWGHRHRLM